VIIAKPKVAVNCLKAAANPLRLFVPFYCLLVVWGIFCQCYGMESNQLKSISWFCTKSKISMLEYFKNNKK